MTQLDVFLDSLMTLLIRYHDSQLKITKIIHDKDPQVARKNTRFYASNVLKEDNMHAFASELIKQSTSGYTGRSPFLSFILFEITFLKSLRDKKEPLEPQQLDEYKALITQLFIDFKKLLMTTKNKTCEVQYSRLANEEVMNYERKIQLSGLKNATYVGNVFCNSGCLLNDEVLERFNISLTSSDNELQAIADSICEEFQNTLLIPKLQTNYLAIQNDYEKQKTTIDSLINQLQEAKSINKTLKAHTKELEISIFNYSNEIAECKETIARLETPSAHDCSANYSSFFAVPSNMRQSKHSENKDNSFNTYSRE